MKRPSASALRRPAALRSPAHQRTRVILTPEGIPLRLTLAPLGARLGALVADLLLVGAVMVATTLALIWIAGGAIGAAPASAAGPLGHALELLFVLWTAAMFLLRNAWFLYFELGPRGATPGKRMNRIRVAARNGGRLTAEMILARNLLRDIELFLPISFLLAARGGEMGPAGIAAAAWFLIFALFPLFNRDSLRAGDLIAGTWVIEAPRPRLERALTVTGTDALVSPSPAYRFSEADLAVYGEYELQVLERVLRENRPTAIREVYRRICAKIGWQAGTGDERAFLVAYYTQLRARLEAGMRLGRRKTDKFDG